MNPTIEKLQSETDAISLSLKALKEETQAAEKEKKKQEFLKQAQKVQAEAEELLKKETEASKKTAIESCKKNIDALLEEVNKMVVDHTENLDPEANPDQQNPPSSVVKNTPEKQEENPDQQASSTPATPKTTEEKGRWDSTKDFTKEQWDHVFSKETWKNETGMNLARTAGFIGTGVGAFMLLKKWWDWAFGDKEKKEEKSDSSASSEKKKEGFWDKWYGKTLKYLGIGAGVGGAVWGIGKLFGLWEKWADAATGTDSDNDKYNSYDHFANQPENKEKLENYEDFGELIDATYQSLYSKELNAGYQDELEMERISKVLNKEKKYKGIVPFCLDNQFGSVEDVMYQNTNFKSILAGGIDDMKRYLINLTADQLQNFVDSYLSKLPSWGLLAGFKGSVKEKIDKWVLDNQQSKEELQFFFRQGVRVQTYLFEKRDQLKQKIVEKTAKAWGVKSEDILNDEEKLNTALNASSDYGLFLSSPIADAVKILQRNQLFDGKVGEHVQAVVKELDEQRDEILGVKSGEKDILQVLNEKQEGNLTENERNQLSSSCDKLIKDVDEHLTEAIEASMWNIYGDLWFSEDAAVRKYFDKAQMHNAFNTIKQTLRQKQLELKNGTLSLDKAKILAETMNNLLAMKKEISLWANTLEREEDENGNIFYRLPGFAMGSWNNFFKGFKMLFDGEWNQWEAVGNIFSSLLGVGTTFAVIGGIVYFASGCKHGKGIVSFWVQTALLPASIPFKAAWKAGQKFRPLQRLWNKMMYAAPNRALSRLKFGGEEGPDKLIDAMKLGYLSLNDASDILKRKMKATLGGKKILEKWKLKFNIADETADEIKYAERVFDQFLSSTKMWDTYLQSLKADRALYQKVIENFDRSPKIMEAIRGDQAIDVLRDIVDEVEKAHLKASNQASQAATEIVESIAESNAYKALAQQFDSDLKILNNDLASASDVKKIQIQKQIDQLEHLKKNFAIGRTQAEIDQLFDFYKVYNSLVPNKSIANLDTLGKMLGKNLPELEDALKNFNLQKLRDLKKAGYLNDIGDEAFEGIVKMLQDVNSRAMHWVRLFKNGDEFLDGIKTFVKILSKTT